MTIDRFSVVVVVVDDVDDVDDDDDDVDDVAVECIYSMHGSLPVCRRHRDSERKANSLKLDSALLVQESREPGHQSVPQSRFSSSPPSSSRSKGAPTR
jgi:hypothetical protein